MELKQKITAILTKQLQAEYVRLHQEERVSGIVVSPKFEDMGMLERQELIDEVLRQALTPDEVRRVLMIAAFTRQEYEVAGAPVRVHTIREKSPGTLEFLIDGMLSDAEYVRKTLGNESGVETTSPRPSRASQGVLVSFKAKGSELLPLTKSRAIQVLRKTRLIEVLPNA